MFVNYSSSRYGIKWKTKQWKTMLVSKQDDLSYKNGSLFILGLIILNLILILQIFLPFFIFLLCKMVMYIWRKAKDNCIYYLSHWNIKTVQSKSATREYLGTLITILQLTSSSLMSISWVYSLFPVLYINTVNSVLATICIKQ